MSGSGKHPGREEKKERELATRFAKGGWPIYMENSGFFEVSVLLTG